MRSALFGSAGRRSSFLKTSAERSLFSASMSSVDWRQWATALRRDFSARKKSARRTAGNGCSSWLTPHGFANRDRFGKIGGAAGELNEQARLWRTPSGQEPGILPERLEGGEGHRAYDKETGRLAQYGLTQQAKLWQTPGNQAGGGHLCRGGARQSEPFLPGQVKLWQTPSTCRRGTESKESKATRPDTGGVDLQTEARNWPTPNAMDGPKMSGSRRLGDRTLTTASRSFLPAPAWVEMARSIAYSNFTEKILKRLGNCIRRNAGTRRRGRPSSKGAPALTRQLSPVFGEWLMGWPRGWTGFRCSATELSRWRRRMRSQLCWLVSNTR